MEKKYTNAKITTFRSRFNQLFEESDKTTTELAKELHVSNQTISAWKTGARSPKEPMIIGIAKHFGVSVEWLMGFDSQKETTWIDYREDVEEEQVPKTEEAKVISVGIDKMDPARREQALKVLQTIFSDIFDGSDNRGT